MGGLPLFKGTRILLHLFEKSGKRVIPFIMPQAQPPIRARLSITNVEMLVFDLCGLAEFAIAQKDFSIFDFNTQYY